MAFVYLNPYQQQLEDARQQVDVLLAQRQTFVQNITIIDQQIAQLNAFMQALGPMAAQEANPQLQTMTLADLCRMALDAHGGEWITAQQVRTYLTQLGVRLNYNNEMSVLHNTLRRVGLIGRDNFRGTVYARKP
jgi:hypothetical protein